MMINTKCFQISFLLEETWSLMIKKFHFQIQGKNIIFEASTEYKYVRQLSTISLSLKRKKEKREREGEFWHSKNFRKVRWSKIGVPRNWTPKYIFPRLLNILGLGLPSILDPVIELWREGERAKRPSEGQRGRGWPSEQERDGMDFELTGGIRKPCTYSVSSGTTTLVWRSPAPSEVDKSRGVFLRGAPPRARFPSCVARQ